MTTETEDIDKSQNIFYPMISFEKQMFLDILENDGLLVCAKGLNEYIIIMNLLRGFNDPGNLVFVINAADYEEKYFMQKLNLVSLPTLSVERQKAYLNGGVHFVSTRILVVDLLKNRVPVEQVTGIIVMRAHSILESCQEAFVLRLYRQKNKAGFIKAFSHSAEAFTFGFSHVEKVMRNLFVKELLLWPRFHGSVIRDLKVSQPNVIELHVPLSNKTKLIQTCILDIMNYTTKELKRINRYLDLQEITSENCLTKKFHKILQAQLDTVWHQLSTKTKELIQDLKVMRSLILSLIHQDAVSFYCLVSKFRTPEYAKTNSGWILLDSAEQMFKYSRSRVFNSEREFEPELCSKWKYLNEILTVEIPEVRKKNKTTMAKSKILLLCNDSKTAKQLNLFLTIGPQAYMYWSAYRNNLDLPLLSKDYKSLEGKYTKDKDSSGTPSSSTGATVSKGSNKNASTTNELDSVVTKEEMEEDDLDQTNYLLTMTQSVINKINNSSIKLETVDESAFEPFTQMENMDLTQLETENPLIFIQTFRNTDGGVCLEDTLREVRPDFIILYHSNVTATRQIELYNSRKDDDYPPLMVFFLIHAQTTEEQAYLTSLRREKEAFELLIQTKSTMVIPSYQDGKSELTSNLTREDPTVVEANTRKGGGQESDAPQERPRVIVDMREFRSDLPALLYRKGIDTDPVTISIGDYILTPDICVERKSLSDLIGSLNSGRLYTQCTQMCRNYARPMLLIEFDQNRPFRLLGHHVVSNDISGSVVQEKLQLLTLHFPRLKLIWSPSPYATADLFFELKQGRPQPNAADASALGEDAGVESLLIERFNPRIHDFLIKLPGVNSKNISRLMNRGQSLDNLIKLSQDEIAEILENKSDAKMLWAILHNDFSSSDASNTEVKNVKKNRFGKPIRSKKF